MKYERSAASREAAEKMVSFDLKGNLMAQEVGNLRAQLAASEKHLAEVEQENERLLEYSRKVAGTRNVHSIYEVLDHLLAENQRLAEELAEHESESWCFNKSGSTRNRAGRCGAAAEKLLPKDLIQRCNRIAVLSFERDRLTAELKTVAYKLGITTESLPGQLPAQIIDAIDALQQDRDRLTELFIESAWLR